MKKPKGARGSWFAEWEGHSYPCVHKFWTESIWPHHCDPGVDDRPIWPDFIEAIKQGVVILTEDKRGTDGNPIWERDGYIALYRVENVELRDKELHFDFVERLANFA